MDAQKIKLKKQEHSIYRVVKKLGENSHLSEALLG